MKMKTIIIVLGMLLPLLNASAQREYAKKYPVMYSILPNLFMGEVINWVDSSAHLYDIKDKLIILDFWNTHCSVCIGHFRSMDSLQRKFADKLQFIMVTGEKKAVVKDFLKNWEARNQMKLAMPFVVGDSTLQRHFPYYYQPAYAWISPRYRLICKSIDLFLDEKIIAGMLDKLPLTAY